MAWLTQSSFGPALQVMLLQWTGPMPGCSAHCLQDSAVLSLLHTKLWQDWSAAQQGCSGAALTEQLSLGGKALVRCLCSGPFPPPPCCQWRQCQRLRLLCQRRVWGRQCLFIAQLTELGSQRNSLHVITYYYGYCLTILVFACFWAGMCLAISLHFVQGSIIHRNAK